MFTTSNFSLHALAQASLRFNRAASTILTAPIRGYSGKCPFLRSVGSVSGVEQATLSESEAAELKKAQEMGDDFVVAGACCCPARPQEVADLMDSQISLEPTETAIAEELVTTDSSATVASNCNNKQPSRCPILNQKRLHSQLAEEQQPPSTDGGDSLFNLGMQPREGVQTMQKLHSESNKGSQALSDNTEATTSDDYDYESLFKQLIKRKIDDGSYRVFRQVRRFSANFPYGTERNQPVTIWCSNDYFGMSSHPRVLKAVEQALHKYGAGSGGTRNIAGNSPIHEELERELADLHDKEAALLFSSCYVANDSTLYTLLKLIPDCHIFSDAGNHASMIQGIRNSAAPRHIFKSFDCQDLELQLSKLPIETPKIVAFETVHSMTGDVSQVRRMCDIAHQYGALTFVDEVHAVGLYGARGAGIGERDGCMDQIDIVSGTLGKAYGNFGGYVASSRQLIDVVRSYASGFIFTTSLPPTVVLGALESVRILKSDEGRYLRDLQQNNVFHFKRSLAAAGLPHFPSKSHIIPIPVGDPTKCTKVSQHLLSMGHYIQSINYPTVPRGTERLRVSVTPFHDEPMIDSLIERLAHVWTRNNLRRLPTLELPSSPSVATVAAAAATTDHKMHLPAASGDGYAFEDLKQVAHHSIWCQLCNQELSLGTRRVASI